MGSGGWVIGVGLGGYEGRVHDNWEGKGIIIICWARILAKS